MSALSARSREDDAVGAGVLTTQVLAIGDIVQEIVI